MSKALLAWVWVAGPLTGTIVQPYIGIRSDNCRSRWGRRKPFIAIGGATTVICLLALAWVRELTGSIFAVFGADQKSDTVKSASIIGAIILMYCHDFGINTGECRPTQIFSISKRRLVQAAMRAYIVDNAPWHQQKSANAWASRVSEAASIISYAFGYMNLPEIFPILGKTQFQVISVIGSFYLVGSLVVSCVFIKEHRTYDRPRTVTKLSTLSSFGMIWKAARHLPPQIKRVFAIQFASWSGWFPFLFYITTYIGQLYVNPIFDKHPGLSNDEIDKTWAEATRIATSAYFLNAVVAFVGSLVLPLLVVAPSQRAFEAFTNRSPLQLPQPTSSYGTFLQSSLCALAKFRVPGLTLRRLWLLSHFLLAVCMFSTVFIASPGTAALMTAIVGIPWMVTSWAPYAFIATELAQHNSGSTNPQDSIEESIRRSSRPYDVDEDTNGIGEAGVVLGLHNVFISFPQMVSSLLSSVIFEALQKPRGEPFDNSVAWVMRFGGCAALVAGFLTMPLQDQTAE
jgi:solute carrier family 45 protein 1/2/4